MGKIVTYNLVKRGSRWILMCVHPQLKIVPNICTIYFHWRYICLNIQCPSVLTKLLNWNYISVTCLHRFSSSVGTKGLGAECHRHGRDTERRIISLVLLNPRCLVMMLMKRYFTDAHYKTLWCVFFSVVMCYFLHRKALICIDSTVRLKLQWLLCVIW